MLSLALKNIFRYRLRSSLTMAGVATGMFLFTTVETMQQSLARVTRSEADDTTLVVYRENRFCPSTSRLPEHYLSAIEKIEGVRKAIPIQIAVNNCGASLDVITFRGVPAENLLKYNPDLEIVDGSFENWTSRSDAALVGQTFAQRRALQTGDQFEAVGVNVYVAGIIKSNEAQDNNVAYVHLPFLQQASKIGLGTVTQFNVKVDSAELLDPVAKKIDATFRSDSQPTVTRPEKAFFAETAKQMIELIGFTHWLGLGAVAAVLGLVANAVLLIVRGRIKETAVLQTLGFSRFQIGCLITCEGLLLGLLGGVFGVVSAILFLHWQSFTLGNEGLTLAITPSITVLFNGLLVALVLGFTASLYPAWRASRQPLVESLNTG